MAASITDNDDLLAYDVIPDGDIPRLGTARLQAETPPWLTRHTEAWAKTLQRLDARNPRISESDLDDTSELKRAVCYLVAHLAYRLQAGSPQDLARADLYFGLWEQEVEEVRLTVSGRQVKPGDFGFRRWLRS